MWNWFKIIIAAAKNVLSLTQKGGDGRDYFYVSGYGTFPIKDKLSAAGFRWNSVKKSWYRDVASLSQDARALAMLNSLDIPFTPATPVSPTETQNPVSPIQQNQPVAKPQQTEIVPPQDWYRKNIKKWFLSTRISDNTPVVVAKEQNDWLVMDEKGELSNLPNSEISSVVKSVKDAENKPITSANPNELFEIYKNQFLRKEETLPTTEEKKETTQETGEAPGRIPETKISKEQKAIEKAFIEEDKNVMIGALAGAGKTATLRHLASFKDPNAKWLYLVFNKKNQVEASTGKSKFPNNVEVLTSHAFLGKVLGSSAEKNLIPRTDLWQNSGAKESRKGERINQILDYEMETDETFPLQFRYPAKKVIKQLASLAKAYAIHPKAEDAVQQLEEIIRKYQIDTDLSTEKFTSDRNWKEQLVEKVLDVLYYSLPGNAKNNDFNGYRDHDDTLWYAGIDPNVQFPHYDVVLADEVQDFNRCQIMMLKKLAEAGAKIVAVGDVNQSIYMWRGSDNDAFEEIKQLTGTVGKGGTDHTLPTNYRSGKKIIEYINKNTVVKDLRAGLDFDGEVKTGQLYSDSMSDLSKEWIAGNGQLTQETAFISRTNAPLVKTALELLKSDMDFVVIGRDLSQEMIKHLERIIGKGRFAKNYSIEELSSVMNNYLYGLQKKWAGKISKADELMDMKENTESLDSIIDYLSATGYKDARLGIQVRNAVGFIEYLKMRFSGVDVDTAEGAQKMSAKDPRKFVSLSSGHRSKGLEFDRVFILHNEMIPHPKAKTPEAIKQEEHLRYVCYSRAKKSLNILVHPKEA